MSACGASKAAVRQLTRHMAVELGPTGVRVNAVAPGTMRTPMTEEVMADPARSAPLLSRIPLERFGHPHELVGPVAFRLSALASFVTGTTLAVDGGYLAS